MGIQLLEQEVLYYDILFLMLLVVIATQKFNTLGEGELATPPSRRGLVW